MNRPFGLSCALCLVACGDGTSNGPAADANDVVDTVETFEAAEGFYVVGSELRDALGKPFVMRGVNNPHVWWDDRAFDGLDAIAEARANTVRIVWQTTGAVERLEEILTRAVALGLVPIIELHDATGKPEGTALGALVDWWTRPETVQVLLKFRRESLINIANEWGDHSLATGVWRDAYIAAITRMRAAGIAQTLVIDGDRWGQGLDVILADGPAVRDSDPEKNVLFSVHMYGLWNEPGALTAGLEAAQRAGLALIVGEFGYDYDEGINNLFCRVDAPLLLSESERLHIGWLAWSWFGNNAENAWLDLTGDGTLATLTSWGELIVDGEHGLRATSRRATIFDTP